MPVTFLVADVQESSHFSYFYRLCLQHPRLAQRGSLGAAPDPRVAWELPGPSKSTETISSVLQSGILQLKYVRDKNSAC